MRKSKAACTGEREKSWATRSQLRWWKLDFSYLNNLLVNTISSCYLYLRDSPFRCFLVFNLPLISVSKFENNGVTELR